ncbi:MAG: nuclear transport factor 2 family protein [Chloroflexota bacterium]
MNTPSDPGGHTQTIERFFSAIRDGDGPVLLEILTDEAVTRWPQSSERITGAMSCVRVYEAYPGGPPAFHIERISGSGDLWVAELAADYGTDRWYTVSIVEFDGSRIARMTDYFGPAFPAPEWRRGMVDLEVAAT